MNQKPPLFFIAPVCVQTAIIALFAAAHFDMWICVLFGVAQIFTVGLLVTAAWHRGASYAYQNVRSQMELVQNIRRGGR